MAIFYWFCWCLLYIPLRVFYPTTVINKKNFRTKNRAILACNHMSNMDIVILAIHNHRKSCILAKHTLFNNKFLGFILRHLGAIPVNREEVGISTIKTAIKLLEAENQMIIFPEGTRKTSIEEADALKNGMALFALKTNSPLIPVVLLRKPKIFRCNKIIAGEPIDLSAYQGQKPTKEILNEVSAKVLEEMQKLRSDYIAKLPEKKRAKLEKEIHATHS